MGNGTYVRPLALYPLILLIPVLLIRLKQGQISRPWPGALTVLLAFILAALAATAIGATLAPLELRGVDFSDRALRAGVTLIIGVSFFAAAVWMNQSEHDLRFSVKWLLTGLAAHLIWGAIQFVGLNSNHRKQLIEIQNLFSVRGLVKNKRISGFAFEPSWLAGQIASLYLPWLVAALLMGYRALNNKFSDPVNQPGTDIDQHLYKRPAELLLTLQSLARSWIEPVLLVGSLIGIFLTYSRSGLVIAMLAGIATIILAGGQSAKTFWSWARTGFDHKRWTSISAGLKTVGSRVVFAALVVAMLIGAATFLADKGYIAVFFNSEKTDIFSYAVDVFLGPRLAYATAALQAFQTHPLTGVGLGASGFGIYQNMPDWILTGVPEIANQMSPTSSLYPNPKNLFVRLLAETGLSGMVLFMTFYLTLFADALTLLRQRSTPDSIAARWLGAAGVFALAAIVLQGISQDSFAMPEMWLNLGMLAGAVGALCMPKQIAASSEPQIVANYNSPDS